MKLNTITIILAALLCLIPESIIYAQDTTETKEDDWEWDWDWEYDEIKDWIHFGKKMPTISVYYGITDINDEQITQPLARLEKSTLDQSHDQEL